MATQSVRIGWRPYVNVVTQVVNAVDADAQAFISAAGITDLTQAAAIGTLVNDLKSYGLWTKMKAFYPMVGGTATSHKWNLKDPRDLDAAYRLTFFGGLTHDSNGVLGNGTNSYAYTNLSQNTMGLNNMSIGWYNMNNVANSVQARHAIGSSYTQMHFRYFDSFSGAIQRIGGTVNTFTNSSTQKGMYILSRQNSTQALAYKNGTLQNTADQTGITTQLGSRIIVLFASDNGQGTATTPSVTGYGPWHGNCIYFADGMNSTEVANIYTSIQKFNTTLGRHTGTPYVSDADAVSFLTAAGITDGTQAAAINTLVIDLKAAGVWSKLMAIYPFVGGTATSHKFNLKDPRDLDAAYRLVFNGGWTHSTTGAKPNGVNGYADSKFAANILSPGNAHMSYYNRTINKANGYLPVIQDNSPWNASKTISLVVGNVNNGGIVSIYFAGGGVQSTTVKSTAWTSFTIGSSTATNLYKIYNSGVLQGTSTANSTNTFSTSNLVIGAHDGALNYTNSQETAFVSFGIGLSDNEALLFNNAVQKYQTTLGRQTDVPLVSDTDAQVFLNAAGITSYTQANAVNTLVTDLKSAGVWTKMKAIYPFVGGTVNTHKFNLKDPRDLDVAYRLVFNGGWVHSSTGAKPNGTTGYADTFLNQNNVLQNNNEHLSLYLKTDYLGTVCDGGIWNGSYGTQIFSRSNIPSLSPNDIFIGYSQQNYNIYSFITNTTSTGLHMVNRTISSVVKLQKNSTTSSFNINTSGKSSLSFTLGARNYNGVYDLFSPREQSFASIGDGLTDVESTALYSAVQKFQTSLGRHVDAPVYNNGLVLNLDAGNANSYPGTGTTWFDLAAGNNGTLVNGPTYVTTNNGYINFDGINDNISFTSNCFNVPLYGTTDEFTINVWINWNAFPNNTHDEIVSWWASGTQTYLDGFLGLSTVSYLGFTNANPTLRFGDGWQNTGFRFNSSTDLNKWWNITAVKTANNAYIYVNSSLVATKGSALSWGFNNVLNIGSQFSAGEYLNAKLSNVQIYNRALSSTEILNNFNSTRGRFGI